MRDMLRDVRLEADRLLKDVDDLLARVRFSRSSRGARDAEALLRRLLGRSEDLVTRRVELPDGRGAWVIFIDGLVDQDRLDDYVIRPLATLRGRRLRTIDDVAFGVIQASQVRPAVDCDELLEAVLRGDVVVGVEGLAGTAVVSLRDTKARGVEDAQIEVVAQGPRDSFTETARWNVALIRRRLVDPNLRVVRLAVGVRSRTDVFLIYLEDVVNRAALEELQRRVAAVRIDGIVDSSMLEHLIEDCWWSPFPQLERTERPDVAAAAILEGRLCLVVDNTPQVLIAPTHLMALFHTPEDIYGRPTVVTLLRLVRFLAAVIALTLPALYVSVAAFNPGLLPVRMAIKIANSREGVALPVIAEALLMQFFLETLREAGFRLPGPIGQTFGIVGGIVLGELGVRAGLVSEMMVVVIALTGIASFTSPTLFLGTSIRLLGLPIMLASAVFGLYGLVLAVSGVLAHLVLLRSLGVPYLVPYPFYPLSDAKDAIARAPLPALQMRSRTFRPQQRRRLVDLRDDRFTSRAGHVHGAREEER